jgi:predicted MPP superfamily phosphohydrolase
MPRRFAEQAMHQCADILRDLACPQRFAVMGNHDDILGAPTIRPILADLIPLLVNNTSPLSAAGSASGWAASPTRHRRARPLPRHPGQPDGPVLLMCHGPDYADTVLAHPRGHLVDSCSPATPTVARCACPSSAPSSSPPGGKKYVEGLFHFDRLQLYVNRGIGTVGVPLRLNCPPEITLVHP